MTTLTPAAPKVSLIVASLCSPLAAVNRRWPRLIHAAEMEEVISTYLHGGTVTAPCGATRLRLLGSGEWLVEWPPAVKGLPEGMERCRECWEATGRKRPRSRFRGAA